MKTWLRRIRATLLMGLTWALLWLPVGLLIGMVMDPDGRMDEPWIAVGTFPGFLSGVIFSVVLGIAAGRRKLDELSLAKVAGWGAVAGLLIGSLPFVLGDRDGRVIERPWLLPLVVVSSITLLSSASAAASLALAKRSQKHELPARTEDVAEVG